MDLIDRQDVIKAVLGSNFSACTVYGRSEEGMATAKELIQTIKNLPSAQTEWNNHTVACLLAELFDDTCACNYNDIDEWLPEKCELLDSCPNPVGVACWEQYLKHRAERRTDNANVDT